jgi:hypothetical protein
MNKLKKNEKKKQNKNGGDILVGCLVGHSFENPYRW